MWVDWKSFEKCTTAKSLTSSADHWFHLTGCGSSNPQQNPPTASWTSFYPNKRLTTREIQLVLFCLFLSWLLWDCAGMLTLWHVFYVKWYLSSWSNGFEICLQNQGLCHTAWHGICFVLFWQERHDLVYYSHFILSCPVENRAGILCQPFSQWTKPSAGWRKTTRNKVSQISRL